MAEDARIDLGAAYGEIKERLRDNIVGMEDVIELLTSSIFAGGHCLLIGVPGLAKTMLVSSLAKLLDLKFSRIQFTPDLMPSDITGAEIIVEDKETGERHFRFMQGPVFANIVLADEINRTPPKTQAALIEAMEERQISSLGKRFTLEEPFFVLATQNPIEQEGTYPLPAAQLDRFLYDIDVGYPERDAETAIMRLVTRPAPTPSKPILDRDQVLAATRAVRKAPVSDEVINYATSLARRTRPDDPQAPDMVKRYVSFGAGPRAAQSLVIGAKALAAMNGRASANHADIRRLLKPVLRHRIVLNFVSAAESITADRIIDDLMASVPAPDWRPPEAAKKKTLFARLSGR